MEISFKHTPRPSPLEKHLGYWLRRVSNAVSGAFSRALQAEQTSVAEWVVLSELRERGETTPGDLASAIGLTRGAVSKIVDKLEAKGWVRSEVNGDDSRSRLLSLTHPGVHTLPVLAEIADRNDARFFDCLSSKEQAVLRKLLAKLVKHNDIQEVPTE